MIPLRGGSVMEKLRIPVGSEIRDFDVIHHESRAWLVPRWLVSPDGKWLRPLRIVAPRFAPGYKPLPGLDVLRIFEQAVLLPASLLDRGVIPPELAAVVEVRESPDISVPNPNA